VLLRVDERAVGEQHLAVSDADGRGRLGRLQLGAADDAGQIPDREVPVPDRLLLGRREPLEL
jgi:hypothetical protein